MKGIMFIESMFRAVVSGKKVQTRRIINPQPDERGLRLSKVQYAVSFAKWTYEDWHGKQYKPRYNPGEIVYLKEPYQHTGEILGLHPTGRNYGYVYKYDDGDWDDIEYWYWKNKMFMPAKAARFSIKITKMSIERVMDISEEDAQKEGFYPYEGKTAKSQFIDLFNHINKEISQENPWVYVYSFTLC